MCASCGLLRLCGSEPFHSPLQARMGHYARTIRAWSPQVGGLGLLASDTRASKVRAVHRMSLQESFGIRRSAHLVGVEILDAENTSRYGKWFNTGFGMAVPTTWYGEVHYRGHQQAVHPGMVFCPMPGEIHTTPRVVRAGSFHAVMIDPTEFETHIVEQDVSPRFANWRKPVSIMSPTLAARMADFLHTLKPAVSAMEIQSSIVSLFESVQELLERAAPHRKVSQERRQQSKLENACTATRVTCWICMRLLRRSA